MHLKIILLQLKINILPELTTLPKTKHNLMGRVVLCLHSLAIFVIPVITEDNRIIIFPSVFNLL